jgi:DNA-directed RNA polymerase specialized sigma24 family protein
MECGTLRLGAVAIDHRPTTNNKVRPAPLSRNKQHASHITFRTCVEVAMDDQERERYELFRHAILLRDEQAWAAIHTCYRSLLLSWARRCCARVCIIESVDDIADRALARAWVALTPASFTAFPTLAKLLAYLRACVTTTAIDCARTQAVAERALAAASPDTIATPEQIVLADFDRAAFWRTVIALTVSEAERIVVIESFAYDMPPRDILARHPRLFPNVAAVYGAKRNLFARLHRNREMARLHEEYAPV